MTHLALLHRARTALLWPTSLLDKEALIAEISDAIKDAYPPKPVRGFCWCGENAVDGLHCNDHSDLQTGDG